MQSKHNLIKYSLKEAIITLPLNLQRPSGQPHYECRIEPSPVTKTLIICPPPLGNQYHFHADFDYVHPRNPSL
jgi:hypothetical protein